MNEALDSIYASHSAIQRYNFIVSISPKYAVKAASCACLILRTSTLDVKGIQTARLNHSGYLQLSSDPSSVECNNFVKLASTQSRQIQEALDVEFRIARANVSKEPVRIVLIKLGDFYVQTRDYHTALKYYTKIKDYCTITLHVSEMCFKIIETSLLLGNISHASSYIAKADSLLELSVQEISRLTALKGIVALENCNFKAAARFFMDTSSKMDYQESDIAVYGGLCALATFDRGELKRLVFSNSNFKFFLESDSSIREILHAFYNSKYKEFISLLEEKKEEWMLDLYLNRHLDLLYSDIRKKALIQYYSTFSSVDMQLMASVFSTTFENLEAELAILINDDLLNCRIDRHRKILCLKQNDFRKGVVEGCVDIGQDIQFSNGFLLRKLQLYKAGMVVKEERQ